MKRKHIVTRTAEQYLAWAMFEDKAYARDLIIISINAAIKERTKHK